MQPIAAWLVARPLNGGVGLIVSLLLPMLTPATSGMSPITGGLVMAYLAFANGTRRALVQAAVAAAILAALALVLGEPMNQIVASAIVVWAPAYLMAALASRMRLITLTLQVSVIVGVLAVLAIFVALGDPTAYWDSAVTDLVTLFREAGAVEYADWLVESRSVVVPQLTMLVVFVAWSYLVTILLLGYGLYQYLPEKTAIYGRFCDLNYGRVIAAIMAIASVLAVFTGTVWLQNISFLIFASFWLQGLAIVHWLVAEKRVPPFVLIGTYILMVPLFGIVVIGFSVLGYLDAWFNFRARKVAVGPE
jgi:hypothetical protein